MKKIFLASAGLLMMLSASGSLMAQTCTAVTPDLVSNTSTVTGNSCASPTGTGDTSISTLCNGTNNTGPVVVYTWQHGTTAGTASGNLTVTPTGASPTYNPALAIASGADCTTALNASFCDAGVNDSAGAGAAESIALTGLNGSNTRYFLFVFSLSSVANQKCGAYSVAVGTLPVKLQSFSIN